MVHWAYFGAGSVRVFGSPTSSACPQPLDITIHAAPTIDLGPDTTLICAGTSITLDANSGNNYDVNVTAAGASDYILSGAFSGNDPPINITIGDTLTFNVNASGHPFYLKTSNTTGTSNAITVANNGTSSETITWSPTTAGTYYYICEYHAGMVGTITVANSTATYAWNTGETTASINVTPTTNTTYTVTSTDGNCVATDDVAITVTPLPTVNLGTDVAICQGDSTLLDAGAGHTNYLWNTGETTQTIYADTAGTYSVTVGNGTLVTNSNSLSFDGQDDYIDYAALLNNPSNNATILFSFKPISTIDDSHSNFIGLLDKFNGTNDNPLTLRFDENDGRLNFRIKPTK